MWTIWCYGCKKRIDAGEMAMHRLSCEAYLKLQEKEAHEHEPAGR